MKRHDGSGLADAGNNKLNDVLTEEQGDVITDSVTSSMAANSSQRDEASVIIDVEGE